MSDYKKDKSILQVFTSEKIGLKDVPPGHTTTPEDLVREQREKQEKFMVEYTRLLGRYVEPHHNKSKWVTAVDIPRVVADGKDLVMMCGLPRGPRQGAAAIAHSQIEDKNPLRFFALPSGLLIINPIIFRHTLYPVFKTEGCLSYPNEADKTMVRRYNKITVMYQTLEHGEGDSAKLSGVATEELNGMQANVFLHETDHCNGQTIYDSDFDPEKSIWLGDGPIIDSDLEKLYGIKKVEIIKQ
jgi:peptide deformylase